MKLSAAVRQESLPPPEDPQVWKLENLRSGGLSQKNYEIHYVRKATIDLYKNLDSLRPSEENEAERAMWIDGSPGVGKSTTLFGWGMHQASCMNKNVLWVHVVGAEYVFLRVLKDIKLCETFVNRKDKILWGDMIDIAVDPIYDIIILDGIKETMRDTFTYIYHHSENCILIGCTSYQSGGLKGQIAAMTRYKRFHMDSWMLENYRKLNHLVLKNFNEESIKEKYYYCGGSIRYFFMDKNTLIVLLNQQVHQVTDYSSLLRGNLGNSSQFVINSLMQVFNDKTTIISLYVVKCIATKVDISFAKQAEYILPENPVWQGWVYELKFLINIRKNECIKYYTCDGNIMEWYKNGNLIEFEDSKYLSNIVMKNNSWLVPMKYNQPAFDAIFFNEMGNIDFFQVTLAKNHKYKFKHLVPFLEHFSYNGECKFRFIIITNKNEFIFDARY